MATEEQIAANRRNALKSTGPRTPEGKARVSQNALKHGLLSRHVLIVGEDAEELAALREGMVAELAPEGALEGLLADRVVAAAWRLGRATRLERDVVEERLAARLSAQERSPERFAGEREATPERMAVWTVEHTDTLGKLSRYEAHIERGMYRALHELERRQAARRGRPVLTPVVVDVDVAGPTPAAEALSAKQSQSEAEQVAAAPTPAGGTSSAKQSQFEAEEAAAGPTPAEEVPSAKQSQSEAEEPGPPTGTHRGQREQEPPTDTDDAGSPFAVTATE